jgi:hypothetical protein
LNIAEKLEMLSGSAPATTVSPLMETESPMNPCFPSEGVSLAVCVIFVQPVCGSTKTYAAP